VEEQFYLFWPVLLVAIGALVKPRLWKQWVLGFALAGAVASEIMRLVLWQSSSICRLSVGPDVAADCLLWGCAFALTLYLVGDAARQRITTCVRIAIAPALLLLVVWFAWLPGGEGGVVRYGQFLVSLTTVALVGFAVLVPSSPFHNVLTWRPAIEIGRRSYGLYLWHFVILSVAFGEGLGSKASVLLEFTLTFVIAWLSFAFVEQPFLRLKGKFATDRPSDEVGVKSWPADASED